MAKKGKTSQTGMSKNIINSNQNFVNTKENPSKRCTSSVKTSHKTATKSIEDKKKIDEHLRNIFLLIKDRTGHDFSNYKETTMYRRISKRANSQRIYNLKEYFEYLQGKPEEIDALFQELLINVTSFFRDAEAFNIIKTKTLPELMISRNEGETIRLWVPGCASGEEAYSLAIILKEIMEYTGKYFKIQIYGTDLDKNAIETASKGFYPENITADISPARIKKFFTEQDGKFHINSEIREMVVFEVHDVLKDPPFNQMDMISCRNLMIYLKSDAQKVLLSIFNHALNGEGLLFLGPCETIGNCMESICTINTKWKLFKSSRSNF